MILSYYIIILVNGLIIHKQYKNMTTISVPIPSFLEEFIKQMVDSGYASNKADVVRRALIRLREEEAINSLLRAERDAHEGRVFSGDLDELAKKLLRKK